MSGRGVLPPFYIRRGFDRFRWPRYPDVEVLWLRNNESLHYNVRFHLFITSAVSYQSYIGILPFGVVGSVLLGLIPVDAVYMQLHACGETDASSTHVHVIETTH